MLFRDFIDNHLLPQRGENSSPHQLGYLAQHELFDQVRTRLPCAYPPSSRELHSPIFPTHLTALPHYFTTYNLQGHDSCAFPAFSYSLAASIAFDHTCDGVQLTGLQHDFEVPRICSLGKLRHMNAWLGPAGTVTPCHYDSYDNIFAQECPSTSLTLAPAGRAFQTPTHRRWLATSISACMTRVSPNGCTPSSGAGQDWKLKVT